MWILVPFLKQPDQIVHYSYAPGRGKRGIFRLVCAIKVSLLIDIKQTCKERVSSVDLSSFLKAA